MKVVDGHVYHNGVAIGMTGPVGGPGVSGVSGESGRDIPFIGQFRWCVKCRRVFFANMTERDREEFVYCPSCNIPSIYIVDDFCPHGVVQIWDERKQK